MGRTQLKDSDILLGRTQKFASIFGDSVVVERHGDIEEQFHYNINTKTLTTTLANGGTVIVEDDMAKISSSTAVDGSAQVESKNIIRYIPAFESFASFTALFESNPIGAIQRIGPFTSADGYYIGFGTDGVFEVGRIRGGVVTPIKETEFNGDKRFTNIDKTNQNVYSIHYGWLGTTAIFYSVMLPNGQWICFHSEKIAGQLATPSSNNPQLPISASVTKTSGATDVIMRSGSWGGGSNGAHTGAGDRFFTADAVKAAVTTEVLVMNLRVLSTFQSKTNRVLIELVKRNLTSDGTKNVIFRIYRNLSIATPTYVAIDATNSVMEKDILGTPTIIAANQEDIKELAKVDRDTEKIAGEGFIFYPGDVITITAQSANASDVSASMRWREMF